ncbi:MAG: hypothetical protein JWR19_3698 [Pedosphaera sp.]|nr:hypothetical protein [Pedosphaera sp.]
MRKQSRFLHLMVVGLFCMGTGLAMGQQDTTIVSTNNFREFVGTCQGSSQAPYLYDLVGWDRSDVYWSALEPRKGEWKQEELEMWGKRILGMRARGVKFLPILCYNTRWSWDRAERTYDYGDSRVHVKPTQNGNYLIEKSHRAHDGNWVLDAAKEERASDHWPLAKENQAAWENYVRRTVEFLRKEPYNVEFFQIWNEAYPTSGFWDGDLDTYMTRVHIPASKIIHELGGKVVYGGWPCCGSIQDYVSLLDRHQAWNTIDVLDVHYFPLSSFEHLYKAAKKRGYNSIGIWQTELAFSKDPAFIGNTFPRFLSWCVAHDWSYVDRYRLFFFCATTPDDPNSFGYDRAIVQGKELSYHGLSMKTLNEAFACGKIELYDNVKTKPLLKSEISEGKSSMESFKVGEKKIVIVIHLVENNDARIFTDWNGNLDSIHLDADNPMLEISLSKLKPNQVVSIERVDMAGIRQSLEMESTTSGKIKLQVPIRDQDNSPAHKWFNKSNVLTFLVEATLK